MTSDSDDDHPEVCFLPVTAAFVNICTHSKRQNTVLQSHVSQLCVTGGQLSERVYDVTLTH